MESQDLFEETAEDWIEFDRLAREGIPCVPPPKFLAAFVRLQRGMLDWKQDTLASFAGVSLSTVQRIEGGERVRPQNLDKVAVALGYKPGDFTEPCVPLPFGQEEWKRRVEASLEPFLDRVPVSVRPLRTQPQVAELARTYLYLIDGGRLDEAYQDDFAALGETLDFLAFVLCTEDEESIIQIERWERVKRRDLYKMVLDQVREIERRANAVALAGTYQAETGTAMIPTADVALIGFFPKLSDPGAIKRRTLFAPAQVDLADAWRRFCLNENGTIS